jgi:hypothetical protein
LPIRKPERKSGRSRTTAKRGHANAFRYMLGSLLAFGAPSTPCAGGYYGMAGAEDVRAIHRRRPGLLWLAP